MEPGLLTIAVGAWFESKQKILFLGHKQLRRKVKNALMLQENMSAVYMV